MKLPFICGNWKMYKTVADAVKYVKEFRSLVKDISDVEIVVAPPFTSLRAAVEAARGLPFPFTLTARAENYLVGIPDLADTIRRLQAYQEAGADVLYAPCITTREEITAIVNSVDRPVNFLMGTQSQRFTLEELDAMGVRRVSVGSALSAAALGAFLRGAREMRETGTFTYAAEAAGFGEISKLLS